MSFRIPEDLLSLVRERRVIPFVGAGFSAGLGLPGWAGLLEQVADDLLIAETDPKLDFKQLVQDASDDYLRVAEYLYLRAGSNIGPLRLSVSHALTLSGPLATSTPHVELVNLGAPQVYTTNFDDAIEATYRELQQPMEVVSLPRDVAVADPHQTQIVKYHGDLRYDDTLVLTESQYWRRLDLESPMDLKFRSDLLGRSVLFMGYSFSDINIRVIWFKLMRMMEDVPESDRKPSYIVRFEPNPVLEALYRDVGLKTIVLDPSGEVSSDEDRTMLLGRFLSDLASAAAKDGRIPGSSSQTMFASKGLLNQVDGEISQRLEQATSWLPLGEPLRTLCRRAVPASLKDDAYGLIERLASSDATLIFPSDELLPWAVEIWGVRSGITALTMRAIASPMMRDQILGADLPWKRLWSAKVPEIFTRYVLRLAESELRGHETFQLGDEDVAYAIDLARRLSRGLAADQDTQQTAAALVRRAIKVYPSVGDYEPDMEGPPRPDPIVEEIVRRSQGSNGDEDQPVVSAEVT